MEEVTVADIEALEDTGDILELALEHDIPLDGCDSCEEFRERILLHKRKLSGQYKHLLDYQRYESLRTEDVKKRDALRSMFRCMLDNRDGPLELLSEILDAQRLTSKLDSLGSDECNVVISGQTSAGKSTMLNMLLGMELLPKHILSCTSRVCKIRYGSKFTVKVVGGQEEEEKTLSNLKETQTYLEDLVALKGISRRDEGGETPEVVIKAPADILKTGVTIVDTPGFGENDAMDTLVSDFVTRGRVAAFVYVIKTDSCGGVQEDRLVRFLKTILDHRENYEHSFNPKTALFVCNRWDQIEDSEKPEVKRNVLEKLRDVWPSLHDNQVCFFSTIRAQASLDVDREYITQELHQLLVSLNSLFILAHQDAIVKSYGWLKNTMKKCSAYLQTLLTQSAMTDREHEETIQTTYRQLQLLESRANSVIDQLRMELQRLDNFLMRTCLEILSCKRFEKSLVEWEESCIPAVNDAPDATPRNQKLVIVDAVVNRIINNLDRNERWALVNSLSSDMKHSMENKMKSLETGMSEISNTLRRASIQSTDSDKSEEETRVMVHVKFRQEVRQLCFSEVDDNKLKSFRDKPKQVMKKVTKTVLKKVKSNTDLRSNYIARYTDGFHLEIETLAHNIPLFIKEKKDMSNNIVAYRLECRGLSDRHKVQRAMETLEPQRQQLQGFCDLYIKDMLSDSSPSDSDDLGETGGISRISEKESGLGIWAQVHQAELQVHQQKVPFMIRRYTCQLEDQYIFREIVKLRCLMHSIIAKFTGMSRVEDQDAFVFEGELRSAGLHLDTNPSQKTSICLLIGVLDGLVALHQENLVHIELTLDTVMVNGAGQVKLCYMCPPRTCRLPADTDVIDAADFTCLSPRVLNGSVYNRDADMYSFGLLVYELLLRTKPFLEQKEWKLSRFITEVDPETMLKLHHGFPEPVSEILKGCLVKGSGPGIHAARIKDRLEQCSELPLDSAMNEPAVEELPPPPQTPIPDISNLPETPSADVIYLRKLSESRETELEFLQNLKTEPDTQIKSEVEALQHLLIYDQGTEC